MITFTDASGRKIYIGAKFGAAALGESPYTAEEKTLELLSCAPASSYIRPPGVESPSAKASSKK